MDLCPLVFKPILKPKVWGGRNLARVLGKSLPTDEAYGESWECADLESGQSVVCRGPAQGMSLRQLVVEWQDGLLGRAQLAEGRFPLLIKFLDAAQDLSVQVHPDPDTARRLGGEVRVKHEAWHVIDAREGACIYRGLRPGVTVAALREAMARRPEAILECIHRIPVKPGHTYYLPSGTLHTLGAGVLVAEIQTPSDVTYRLYDWGRARPAEDAGLHVEAGLACVREGIDFAGYEQRSHVTGPYTTVTRLVTCPSFVLEKVRFIEGVEQEIPYAELVCWILLQGHGRVLYGKGRHETFTAGEVLILPAGLADARIKTESDCVWLEVTLPAASDLADFPRPSAEALRAPPQGSAGLIQINMPDKPHKSE